MRIVIIGAGFSGMGAAIRLRQAGFDDVVILERGNDVGGVWRDNSYPGCACDVQSHLYSFSFAPNPAWTRSYSRQPEIFAYLRKVADDFSLRPLVRFGTDVHGATWTGGRWQISTSQGELTADVLIAAQGALSNPTFPALPGLDTFAGQTMHTGRWDKTIDLTGRRVAVIGTGASAIQLVPAIQPLVAHLSVFQRTPPWILPRNDGDIPSPLRALYTRLPLLQRIVRAAVAVQRELLRVSFVNATAERVVRGHALRYLKQIIADPVLRRQLTPRYAIGCKRILMSDDYLPALTRDNVQVVTDGIAEITADGVRAGGRDYPVDTLIFATGFQVTDPPLAKQVTGRDGQTLAQAWQGSMHAHVGTTVHGFPSFFMLLGPNTGLGHSSVVAMMEAQLDHLVAALHYMRAHGVRALEPTIEAQDAFVKEVDQRMAGTVWLSGGCRSWYLDATGRNSTLWPGSTSSFRRRVAPFDPREYHAPRALPARSTPA